MGKSQAILDDSHKTPPKSLDNTTTVRYNKVVVRNEKEARR